MCGGQGYVRSGIGGAGWKVQDPRNNCRAHGEVSEGDTICYPSYDQRRTGVHGSEVGSDLLAAFVNLQVAFKIKCKGSFQVPLSSFTGVNFAAPALDETSTTVSKQLAATAH